MRHATSLDRQSQLLGAFQTAITTGVPTHLAALLSDDIRLSADGGGRVTTVLDVLTGKALVMAFVTKRLHEFWAHYEWRPADMNGRRGFVLAQDGETCGTVTFAYNGEGLATDVYIMRNPDKLAQLSSGVVH